MDFITGFPRTVKKNKSIMVVVGNLSKASPFIPIKSTHKASDITNIFMKEIFRLHGLPTEIVSYRDRKFTSKLWKGLFHDLVDALVHLLLPISLDMIIRTVVTNIAAKYINSSDCVLSFISVRVEALEQH